MVRFWLSDWVRKMLCGQRAGTDRLSMPGRDDNGERQYQLSEDDHLNGYSNNQFPICCHNHDDKVRERISFHSHDSLCIHPDLPTLHGYQDYVQQDVRQGLWHPVREQSMLLGGWQMPDQGQQHWWVLLDRFWLQPLNVSSDHSNGHVWCRMPAWLRQMLDHRNCYTFQMSRTNGHSNDIDNNSDRHHAHDGHN